MVTCAMGGKTNSRGIGLSTTIGMQTTGLGKTNSTRSSSTATCAMGGRPTAGATPEELGLLRRSRRKGCEPESRISTGGAKHREVLVMGQQHDTPHCYPGFTPLGASLQLFKRMSYWMKLGRYDQSPNLHGHQKDTDFARSARRCSKRRIK